jgi:hypothetical protein
MMAARAAYRTGGSAASASTTSGAIARSRSVSVAGLMFSDNVRSNCSPGTGSVSLCFGGGGAGTLGAYEG